jgi:hypothetical protein
MRLSCAAAECSFLAMRLASSQGIEVRKKFAAATQLIPPKTHRANDMTLLCSLGRVNAL